MIGPAAIHAFAFYHIIVTIQQTATDAGMTIFRRVEKLVRQRAISTNTGLTIEILIASWTIFALIRSCIPYLILVCTILACLCGSVVELVKRTVRTGIISPVV